jgi:hypothetical protein
MDFRFMFFQVHSAPLVCYGYKSNIHYNDITLFLIPIMHASYGEHTLKVSNIIENGVS